MNFPPDVLISTFGSEIDVFEFDKGSFINGIWTKGSLVKKETLLVSVHGLDGYDIKMFPKGSELSGKIKFYSEKLIHLPGEKPNSEFRINYNNDRYKILKRTPYICDNKYYKYIMELIVIEESFE